MDSYVLILLHLLPLLMLTLSHLWPMDPIQIGYGVLSRTLNSLWLSWCRMSQVHLYNSCHFSKGSYFVLIENDIQRQQYGHCVHCYQFGCFQNFCFQNFQVVRYRKYISSKKCFNKITISFYYTYSNSELQSFCFNIISLKIIFVSPIVKNPIFNDLQQNYSFGLS